MTLPEERWAAVDNTREFLYDLLRDGNRVPKEIKQKAKGLLRHYPSPYYTQACLEAETKNELR